jgi:DNA replicative helicase MCM subunit Mcm2 (Cdc46/Mcm family)
MHAEPPCQGKTFRLIEGDSKLCRDYQEIKIQEQIQQLTVRSLKRSVDSSSGM